MAALGAEARAALLGRRGDPEAAAAGLAAALGLGAYRTAPREAAVVDLYVQAAECAPYIYQLYMALGICLSSWLVLAWEPFAFTWWGLPATVRRSPLLRERAPPRRSRCSQTRAPWRARPEGVQARRRGSRARGRGRLWSR